MHAAAHFPSAITTCANAARLELDYLERFGTYVRLHYENRTYSNVEELQHAARLAGVLTEHGVRAGDRVVVLMPNSPDLTASFHAIWTAGAVICPVIPQWTAGEVAHILRNSGAVAMLTIPALAARGRDASLGIDTLKSQLVFGETDVSGAENICPEMEDGNWIESPANRSSEDLAMLLYTSGTTAEPKGVMITHGNVAAAVESGNAMNSDLPRLPMLHALPLTHVFGMITLKLANHWGLTSILLRQFEPLTVFEAIQQYRVGYMPVVPTMLFYLLHFPDRAKFDFSSMYRIISGGAALPEKLRVDFQNAFACRVDQGYGLSETLAMATSYDDHESYRPGSVGRAEPGIKIRILDNEQLPLPPRAIGEIALSGANVARGYWHNTAANQAAFQGGWFHTGDIGYLDEDDYLYITDRKKDLILKGGENISPREIEEALYLHPAVAEAAVIGVPDIVFGEEICAVVQLKLGAQANEDEIRLHVGQHVTRFKVPRQVVFQETLPKNSSGKILKRAIREKFRVEEAS